MMMPVLIMQTKDMFLETCIATHNQEHCRTVIKNKFLLRESINHLR
jgi:hypothetical protein